MNMKRIDELLLGMSTNFGFFRYKLDFWYCEFTLGRHPQREILSPLEVSLDHLWATPPSHFTPQKVRGFVVGFTGLRGVVYNPNGSRTANSVKRILGLLNCQIYNAAMWREPHMLGVP
jgi:hypothetical protein